MKILVAIKRVIDPYAKIRVKPDGSGVEVNNVKMSMNPFCEIAVEEAIRLKEAGHASEVIAVSIGEQSSQEQLRNALALGADRAIHIEIRNQNQVEPLNVAKLLRAVMTRDEVDLVLLGKQSIDTDNNQVAQMLAALSSCAQGTFISSIVPQSHPMGADVPSTDTYELPMGDVVTSGGSKIASLQVTRETDAGLETLNLNLPAILSTDLRLNEPRYASLPNIMKAKKKPLDVVTPEQLGVAIESSQQILEIYEPQERQAGVIVSGISELVDKLKNEAKVLPS
ncbi:electron transfer flavoprotein subunit beta/FixA family protein [Vibrio sp. 99-70-13A1]|uniref:electron transfer flavoprotein subunit beta/FixA family protein n=1 Tax=Vibrio sp. 99-70-13A1 TaxID=2607601 RepID=UPI001493C6C7|nr:electron transfer flavoprotein subunit beta/FixA family protein [Vibrio sp. 99-70-13A1]NOH95529.1 electron transfer flavoprotein subunit beta/FixA family protein [Vibrio sp. 99-70-13A1]